MKGNTANTTTVTVKGQIVIPASLRRRHGIHRGMRVRLVDAGDDIIIRPVTSEFIQKFAGILPSTGDLERELRAEHARERRRERRRG